jgi:hypothetical protein
MTNKARYILLAVVNCLLFNGFVVVYYLLTGGADDRRLVDLNFASDFKLIMALLAMIVGAFVCNLSLMWRTHSRDVEREEIKKTLVEILKRQSDDGKAHASSV